MNISKKDRNVLIIIVIFVVSIITWAKISMYWSKTTCAKIVSIKHARGTYVNIQFVKNGEIVEDRVEIAYFRYKNLKDLQKKECCEIKYSNYWPYNIEIIDEELKAQ
jgi:hypothetical protein